ncbi:DUF4157 domain-containing protein [Flavobacterium sp. MC2016-06]|jgi:hypothetical protein|uniref:eCIS core domain-containing protein n=1 Tax=Flavobacterium sp. MC2016-06 TaxID=2676308 RepID=UPI0012BA80B6|nr:DUF4157 domain-containing protein [Flavobacterium sp. MC2016-06]MBU3857575.1 DUF4157 domain-containing protein [Flavobacterium sp. MC2016-06]
MLQTNDKTDKSKTQSISDSLNNKIIQTKAIALQDNRPRSVLQRKANHTGLPDNLKSGIENLSGHSMDDVKVHYNSDKPAQLNAHAYAQGTDIHIASGQEKHLPHEAWHVVQQKQGRVKPTLQMKGKVNINDDKGLENEADVMGAKALQLKPISSVYSKQKAQSSIIQRKISVNVNKNDKYAGDFNSYLNELDSATQKAYFYVIHYPDLRAYANLDGHTEHWIEAWNNFTVGKEKGQGLLKAAFGYAVETLATIIYLPSPGGGLSAELQGIRGGTRPDVILKDGPVDVGWLDITASESEGHVWKKAGWMAKDLHKGEVSYPSLDPQIIKHNLAHNIQYDDKTDPKTILQRVNYLKHIQYIRRLHWKNIGEKYFGTPLSSSNKEYKRQYIRKRVAEYLGVNYSDLPPQTLGSVLYAMGQGAKKHGYDKLKGLSKAKGESILQEHDRELPGIENFSSEITRDVSDYQNSENIQKIMANSGNSGFTPSAFHYDPSLSDESALTIRDKGPVEITGLAKKYQSYLDTPFELNYLEIKSLFAGMKKSMRENAIKGFGIKIRLFDGTTGIVRVDKMTNSSLKRYFANAVKYQKDGKKRRDTLIWKKRREITHNSAVEHNSVPHGLTAPQGHATLTDSNDQQLLTIPLSFQVVGFAFQFENGNTLIVSSPGDFHLQPSKDNSHKELK